MVGLFLYGEYEKRRASITQEIAKKNQEIKKKNLLEKKDEVPEEKKAPAQVQEEVFCEDFVEYACSLPDGPSIDDGAGIYNLTLGKNELGITKKQEMTIEEFEKMFFSYFKDINIDNINCYDLVSENIENMKKYWPKECEEEIAKCKRKKHKKLCKKMLEYNCYEAGEIICLNQRCKEIDELKWDYLSNCRKRAYKRIWEFNYSDIDSSLTKIFDETLRLAKEVIKEKFPNEAQDFIADIERTWLFTKEFYDEFDINEGQMIYFSFTTLENAMMISLNDDFSGIMIGLGTISRIRSKNVIMSVLAHELGHIIDPLRMAMDYCFEIKDDKPIIDKTDILKFLPNPFLCKDVPESLKEISKEIIKKIDLYDYPLVSEDKTEIYTYLGEMFSDWFAVQVLNKALPYDTDLAQNALINIARLFCNHPLEGEDDGTHPRWKDRINKLFRAYLKRSTQLFKCVK